MKILSSIIAAFSVFGTVAVNSLHVERNLVLNGTEVPKGKRTYMASIRSTPGGNTFCGGVLITPTHVLTTGGCTTLGEINYAVIGTHYSNGTTDGESIKVIAAQNHTNFNITSVSYDFAVLTLEKASSFTPVRLPNANGKDIVTGMWTEGMGWGITSYPNGTNSYDLMGVDLQVWSIGRCQVCYHSVQPIDDTMVCAGGVAGKATCVSDNGGPIIKSGAKGGDDIVIGLASWGYGCGFDKVPGVYSRVPVAIDWINSVTKK